MRGAEGHMKHFLLLTFVVMLAAWYLADRGPHHADFRSRSCPPPPTERSDRDAHRNFARAGREFRLAMRKTGDKAHEAWNELGEDLRGSLHEMAEDVRDAIAYDSEPAHPGPPAPPAPPQLPEHVLAEAPLPPQPPSSPGHSPAAGDSPVIREITGEISYNEERARGEARAKLNQEVTTWLEARGVPRSWKPAPGLLDTLIVETTVKPVLKDYGTLYQATLRADFSPRRAVPFVQSYQHQLVHRRIVLLGSGLAFVLCCLTALAGYIRADEATKGYCTNRLRLLATVGVAAAGLAIYKFMA